MRLRFKRKPKHDWNTAYDKVWRDHLARCNCHDAWDQCPCTEVGHNDWTPGRMIATCRNRCCRWCAIGEAE